MGLIETFQVFEGGWWSVKYAGEVLRDKSGNYRRFKTEEAAVNAALRVVHA